MAMDINNITIVGRLTDDAKGRQVGESYKLEFNIASNGRKRDDVSYFPVDYWGNGAESIQEWMTKGRQVVINGSLKQDRWERDGEKKSRIFILAFSIQFVSSGERTKREDRPQEQKAPEQRALGPESFDDGDDIPF